MKGVVLLSGGFDSVVAAHKLQSAMEIVPLHCSLQPLTNHDAEQKARLLAKHLSCKGLYIVRIGEALAHMSTCSDEQYYFILQKRLFLRIAQHIAYREGCEYIITGDNLGQVASQTLSNLGTISYGCTLPILRPLLTFDKQEIIDYAKLIGTYEISKGPEMCDVFGIKHPLTKSKLHKVLEEESKCNEKNIFQAAVETLQYEIVPKLYSDEQPN